MEFAMQVTETTNEGLKRAYKVVVPAADIENKLRLVSVRLPNQLECQDLGQVGSLWGC